MQFVAYLKTVSGKELCEEINWQTPPLVGNRIMFDYGRLWQVAGWVTRIEEQHLLFEGEQSGRILVVCNSSPV